MKRPLRLLLLAVVVVAAAWALITQLNRGSQAQLPVLGQVPDFSLIGSQGQVVTHADLNGHVWVADFIFTTCPGICPILSSQMGRLIKAVPATGTANGVRFVSFSVDPTNDTPEALRAYAARYAADPQRWLFLTGPRDALYNVIHDGFHLAVAERSAAEAQGGELITHSDRFVLVDRQRRIRAYYHGTEEGVVQDVVRDIERLTSE